ncbi:uncharacterized protein METZ01_LOCUS240075, partial [marine metagenome]
MLDAGNVSLSVRPRFYAVFLPSADTVNDFEVGAGTSFYNIRADAVPPVALVIIFHGYGHLTLSVLSDRYASDFEVFQVYGHARRSFDCFERCLDRAVAHGSLTDFPPVGMTDSNGCGGNCSAARRDIELIHLPRTLDSRAGIHDDGFNIRIKQFFLPVSQAFEVTEGSIQFIVIEFKSELSDAFSECMAATVFTQHQVRPA